MTTTPHSLEKRVTSKKSLQNCTILLVEGGQSNRKVIRDFVNAEKHRLLFATDYDDALQILECNPVDLVLLDSELSGRSSFELCQTIRETEHISEIPVIMINSRSDHEICTRGVAAGVDDFIAKPINGDVLKTRVRSILRLNYYRTLHVENMQGEDENSELSKLKKFDPTTGLANLQTFTLSLEEEIQRAHKAGYSIAIMAIGANEVSHVQDVYGEAVAGNLARSVANRLSSTIRGRGMIGRIVGRCFISFQPIPREDELLPAVLRARKTFNEPFIVEGDAISVSSSIGASVYPNDAMSADRLISLSVSAMTRAAKLGRNRYQVSAPSTRADVKRQLRVEGQVFKALAEKKFELHYQPRVGISDGRVTAVEALLRMRGDDGEYVPPNIFLPVTQNAGLMTQLGVRAINEACRKAAELRDSGHPDVRIGVNLTGDELRHENFLHEVSEALQTANVIGSQLEFEINESALVPQPDFDLQALVSLLTDLRALGVRVAIDDFGTGYSSLNYLRHIPMDSLKIDQSFIRDIPDDPKASAVACSIISMGQNLGMKVVAEGVENDTQLQFLRHAGCNELQGYLYARPMPFEELADSIVRIQNDWTDRQEHLTTEQVTLSGDSVEITDVAS
ncbi:MAG: EAL domain-containing protein [Gammaproteobacteria bacterium]|nr:EAL domain-containing protein [Gammaproteobacteria bacterium]